MRKIDNGRSAPGEARRVRLFWVDFASPGSNSAVHRCTPIARELDRHGFECEVAYRPNTLTILRKGLKHRVILFRRHIYPWTFLLALFFRLLRKPVVLDIDDSVFTIVPGTRHGWLWGPVSWVSTVLTVLSSSAVVVGSHFLRDFAAKYNRMVFLVPTPVDTGLFRPGNRTEKAKTPVLGSFASTDSHFEFLKQIKEPLVRLSREVPFRLMLLGAERFPRTRDTFSGVPFPVDVTPWLDLEKIPEAIDGFDVNLYPLADDDWSRGKCGVRILEAMCMEVPSVASRVGENSYIISDGEDGLLASTVEEWAEKLRLLIANPGLRKRMGQKGREKAVKEYSQEVVGKQYASVLRQRLQHRRQG